MRKATKFCDEDPCDQLKRAFEYLVPDNRTKRTLQFDVVGRGADPTKPFIRVNIEYCPFCGTRIDKDILDRLDRRGSRR